MVTSGHDPVTAKKLVPGALKPPDQAPSPTCPFIKTYNVKEPWVKEPTDANNQATIHPDRNRGILPVHVGDRSSKARYKTSHTAAVNSALGASSDSVNSKIARPAL
jgi:hypothetical protein